MAGTCGVELRRLLLWMARKTSPVTVLVALDGLVEGRAWTGLRAARERKRVSRARERAVDVLMEANVVADVAGAGLLQLLQYQSLVLGCRRTG